MNLLRPGSHSPRVLVALCIAIIGMLWFLEQNARTMTSGPVAQTINPIQHLAPGIDLALNHEHSQGVPPQARIREAFGRAPLSFEINRGQTDAQVKFLSHGPGYRLFLTSTEAVLSLSRPAMSTSNQSTDGQIDPAARKRARQPISDVAQNSLPGDVVRMSLFAWLNLPQ